MILPRRTPPRYAALGSPADSPLVSPTAAVESALASFVSASRSSWRARSRVIPSLRPAVTNECCSPSKPKRSSIKRCSRSGSVRNALSTAPRRANDRASTVACPRLCGGCFVFTAERKLDAVRCTRSAAIRRRKRTPRLVFPDRAAAHRAAFWGNRPRCAVAAPSTTE
jgi:hypothetical protein